VCRLLGTRRGIVALTKCDLADGELQDLAELEVRELIAGSFLEGAPVVRTSSETGVGLPELRSRLVELARVSEPRPAGGLPRLPVDRVFTMRGFGTVATGTLVAGRLAVGDALEAYPTGAATRVRGLQVHGVGVDSVDAGHRTAVNLAGLEPAGLSRGDVLAPPDTLRPTSMLDVTLRLVAGERALKDQARVRVHLASAEILGRVRLLEGSPLEQGGECVAQLRLERPTVAGRGDHYVLRAYSPARTIGGGRVIDPLPPKRGRRDAAALVARRALSEAPAREAALALIAASEEQGIAKDALVARVTAPGAELDAELNAEPAVTALADAWIATSVLLHLAEAAETALQRYHRRSPLKARMPLEELRQRVFRHAADGAFDAVVEVLVADGRASRVGDGLAHHSHAVSLSPEEQRARETIAEAASAAGLSGLEADGKVAGLPSDLVARVRQVMLDAGELQRVGAGLLVHGPALDTFKSSVRERWPAGSELGVGEVKELTGLSRKYVIPLLEYLDAARVTRRSGNTRTVIG
jgi:selenocysteine-specific elongation factor